MRERERERERGRKKNKERKKLTKNKPLTNCRRQFTISKNILPVKLTKNKE